MSLFTLGSARAVLVVALVFFCPDVFDVIMALISPYTNQPSLSISRCSSRYEGDIDVSVVSFVSISMG
jgi:hypothetical protein